MFEVRMSNQTMKWRIMLLISILTSISALSPAPAEGLLYYSRTDGAVVAVDVTTGEEVCVIASTHFMGANPGAAREIAFDPATDLMWYSSTDNLIYSLNVRTLEPGPTITGIPGLAVGAARHLFIDYARGRLLVPLTDGSVQMYSLADQKPVGSIPTGLFTGGNVQVYRHFASDVRSGMLWYAATDGSFHEMDPDRMVHTGRVIPFSVRRGANPGAYCHFVVDPKRCSMRLPTAAWRRSTWTLFGLGVSACPVQFLTWLTLERDG